MRGAGDEFGVPRVVGRCHRGCPGSRQLPPAPLRAHCLVFLQVQIDPYLEDSMCQVCSAQPGPFFCRDQVRLSPAGCARLLAVALGAGDSSRSRLRCLQQCLL